MTVAIIAAVADNGVIGREGGLPWRLPSDLKHFKRLTVGNTVVMGRRTYESIGRPLPDRRTIVVTHRPLEGVETAASLEEAIARAETPVFLAGGAAIYEEGLPLAETLYLTRVHARPEGDVRFPDLGGRGFVLAAREPGEQTSRDEHSFTYETYVRAPQAA